MCFLKFPKFKEYKSANIYIIPSTEFVVEVGERGKYSHESLVQHALCELAMKKY